jgi:hypothetical protein
VWIAERLSLSTGLTIPRLARVSMVWVLDAGGGGGAGAGDGESGTGVGARVGDGAGEGGDGTRAGEGYGVGARAGACWADGAPCKMGWAGTCCVAASSSKKSREAAGWEVVA